jgi:predicted phosphodiesterase
VRYLILSDIHANRQALEAVLEDAGSIGYDAVLCLGDIVGYGADPVAAIEQTLALAPAAIVRGNHDKIAAGLESTAFVNEVARRSLEWTQQALSPSERITLAELPKGPLLVTPAIEICHGAPFDEDAYIFDASDAARAINAAAAPLCLFGHTHLPAFFTTSASPPPAITGRNDDEVVLPDDGPALVNVGSVGQPRDGDPRAAYGVLDLEARRVRFRRVVYDVKSAQQRILAAGLPFRLAQRLGQGR